MSWSFSAVGTPAGVLKVLETQNAGLTGQSKTEWEDAKPALSALVEANVGYVVSVRANGHASFRGDGTKISGQCDVEIKSLPGFVE